MVDSLLRIITIYSNRESARKSALIRRVEIDEKAKSYIVEKKKAGKPHYKIVQDLWEKGYKTTKGAKISSHIVSKIIATEFESKVEESISGVSILDQFLASGKVEKSKNGRIKSKTLKSLYDAFCRENDLPIDTAYKVGCGMTARGYQSKRPNGVRTYYGIAVAV